jgi:hypothetical protein
MTVFFVSVNVCKDSKIFPGYQPCQMVKRRINQCFKDHLCPHLQSTDVSGESVRARYRAAQVPRSCWCARHWKLLVGVKSLLREAGFLIG